MKNYQVERNPLAALEGCDEKSIAKLLEAKLKSGLALVAVVEYGGTPFWIFSAAQKSEPAEK